MDDNQWTTDQQRWRLVDGALAFSRPAPDGGQLVATPAGEYVALRLNGPGWSRLQGILDGQLSPATGLPGLAETDRAALRATLDLLLAEGLVRAEAVLRDEDTGSPGSGAGLAARGDVLIVGSTLVAAASAEILAGQGVSVRVVGSDGADLAVGDLRGVAGVVACAGWLPDRAWGHLDELCGVADVPWHRCWREGGDIWLGPLSVPGRSPSYRDLRLRRLAASDWPSELAATWDHLESGRLSPPQWAPGVPSLMAATLATDLFAWFDPPRSGRAPLTPPSTSSDRNAVMAFRWRGWDVATGRWHSHPVLPVPVAAPVATAEPVPETVPEHGG